MACGWRAAIRSIGPVPPHRIFELEGAVSSWRREVLAASQILPEIDRRLAELQVEAARAGRWYEAQLWSSVPSACATLFAEAEEAREAYARALCRIDSVAMHAYEAAAIQRDGQAIEAHPAHWCWQQLAAMMSTLTAQLGSNATRDFKTGPALVKSVEDGTAEFSDVSRFMPRSQGVEDGSMHVNRPSAQEAPGAMEEPWPTLDPSEPQNALHEPVAGSVEPYGDLF